MSPAQGLVAVLLAFNLSEVAESSLILVYVYVALLVLSCDFSSEYTNEDPSILLDRSDEFNVGSFSLDTSLDFYKTGLN
jgi:hypothetical protein